MTLISRQLADSADTDRLGRALARARPDSAVVHLEGDLGAGKSTLARAMLRALGVEGSIRSPTYTLNDPAGRFGRYLTPKGKNACNGQALVLD